MAAPLDQASKGVAAQARLASHLELPPDLELKGWGWTKDTIAYVEKAGRLLTYESTVIDGILRIHPRLRYIERQNNGGPIYPFWVQQFQFTLPTLSIFARNGDWSATAITTLELAITERRAIRQPWITLNELNFHTNDTAHLLFSNYGWDEINEAQIEFDTVEHPDHLPPWNDLKLIFGDGSEIDESILSVDGPYWDRPMPYKSKGGSEHKNSFTVDRSQFHRPNGSKFSLLFGWLSYRDSASRLQRLRFVTRAIFTEATYSGRLEPSYKYNVEIPIEGPQSDSILVPVSHDLPPQGVDMFCLAIFTRLPAFIAFDLHLHLIEGISVKAGRVELTTFFPSSCGLRREPERSPLSVSR